MKLGILGTGMIVKDLMSVYNELHIEETYILGTSQTEEETENMVHEYHLTGSFYNYEDLLKSDIDTIYCALPNHLHYAFSKKALEAGKHVIIEKPITANAKELEELIEIAHQKHVMIFEAMNIHYLPSYLSLKDDLNQLGHIKVITFNYSQYSSRYNAFKEGHILPAFDYHKSGGALMDLNVYNIHALLGLFGKPDDNHYFANIEKGIDTSGMMIFEYPLFKAITIGAKDCKVPIMNTIQGDQAAIVIESPLNQMFEYSIHYNDGKKETKHFEKRHRLIYEFEEFIRIIKDKDFIKQQKMLELSLDISRVMEKGRKQEGVVFDNDR